MERSCVPRAWKIMKPASCDACSVGALARCLEEPLCHLKEWFFSGSSGSEDEARALGIGADVRFLGKIDAVAPLLAAADLYLFPSETESFGLSALEALASGVPVVGSRVGGLPELVRDGVTGALVELGDVDGMARRAIELLRPDAWRRASAAAAADARERFSTVDVVARYEAIYEEALADARAGAHLVPSRD